MQDSFQPYDTRQDTLAGEIVSPVIPARNTMPHLQPDANPYTHNRIRWQMNGNIPPHLPQSKDQPKSGQMAGVQRRGRSPATVSPMIINELNPRCRSARSFCEFLKL